MLERSRHCVPGTGTCSCIHGLEHDIVSQGLEHVHDWNMYMHSDSHTHRAAREAPIHQCANGVSRCIGKTNERSLLLAKLSRLVPLRGRSCSVEHSGAFRPRSTFKTKNTPPTEATRFKCSGNNATWCRTHANAGLRTASRWLDATRRIFSAQATIRHTSAHV